MTLWAAAHQASMSFTISWSWLKFMPIKLMMPSSHFILCHPILLLPSIFPSIRVFFNELALLIRWPKYCSFSISPSNEQSGLISFRIDWFGPYFTIQCFISKFFTCICLVRFLECGKDLILQRSQVWVRKHGWWGAGREGEQ